jgi:hypothetical protein
MQALKKKLDSLKNKRKSRKQANQSIPELLQSNSQSNNQPLSNAQIKDHINITASEKQASESTPELFPNPTSNEASSNAQIRVNALETVSSLVPTPISGSIAQARVVEVTPSATPTPTSPSIDFNFNQRNLELAQVELKAVSETFEANFRKFLKKNANLVTFDTEIESLLQASHSETNIQLSARQFRQQVNKVTQLHSQGVELASHKWYSKVGSFVLTLYPAVRMSLGVTSEITALPKKFGRDRNPVF